MVVQTLFVVSNPRGADSYLYFKFICIVMSLWHKCSILDESIVNKFLNSLSHLASWMYGSGNIKILEGADG